MRVLVTGAKGFIGMNLTTRLQELKIDFSTVSHKDSKDVIHKKVSECDFVIHLAGVNRVEDNQLFQKGNGDFTQIICEAVKASGKKIPILFSSSIQSDLQNPYGISKKAAEDSLLELSKSHNSKVYIYKLPNVFGKWCRPNYNSAVATFCHNICRGLPIQINNSDAPLKLIYVDDVITEFVQALEEKKPSGYVEVKNFYTTTVGEIANILKNFEANRKTGFVDEVGLGLKRALYATYLSHFPTDHFSIELQAHTDPRGTFVEMLKMPSTGQFSYFTAHPGVTRGGHYHHTKSEKFLVVQGEALFEFVQLNTKETFQVTVFGDKPTVVDSIPGWAHNIKNVGNNLMIVLLWANEVFDRNHPDTVTYNMGNK